MSLEVQKMSDTNKLKQPKFTLEFKQDAARLVIEKGYTHQQAADSLGVSESALGPSGIRGPSRTSRLARSPH